jgi:AraC-like DNA-binding protein
MQDLMRLVFVLFALCAVHAVGGQVAVAEPAAAADVQLAGSWTAPSRLHDNDFLVGPARVDERAYRVRDLYDAGARVVLSSDYDVGPMSPFVGMARAVDRGDQSLPSVEAALRAVTIEAAWVLRQEELVGSLEVGKRADFVVVDRDVFTCCGGTAALDMMLHFVREAFGVLLAQAVAEQFIYPRIRDEEEDQRTAIQNRYAVASPRLAQVIGIMEATLEEPVPLSELARRVGISVRQVERLFKDQMGMGPSVFYLQRRLERARTLLRQTLQPIREVAVECGFGSTAHFSHAYKKAFGLPPTRERVNARSPC